MSDEPTTAGTGYSLAETIHVPSPSCNTLMPRESCLTTTTNRTRKHISKLNTTDPHQIVKAYWQGSLSSRKIRKLPYTRSKIRQSILLAEELHKLEKEDVLWKEEYADPAGTAV